MIESHSQIYFAYGSNMFPEQMDFRCPGSVPLGIATLPGYRFIINNRGVATIAPHEDSAVIGVLWSITDEHERTLDRYEGVESGQYYKDFVTVSTGEGEDVSALVYIDPVSDPGPPREGYLEKILSGAEHFGLPVEYIGELNSWEGE